MENKMNIFEARKLLNLPVNFDLETLKKSYHKLITKWHPDKFTNSSLIEREQAEIMSKHINEANDMLEQEISNHNLSEIQRNQLKNAIQNIKKILEIYINCRKKALLDLYLDNFTLFSRLETLTKKDLNDELNFLYYNLPTNSFFITSILLVGAIKDTVKFFEQNVLEDYLENIIDKRHISENIDNFLNELDKYTKVYYNAQAKTKHQ